MTLTLVFFFFGGNKVGGLCAAIVIRSTRVGAGARVIALALVIM